MILVTGDTEQDTRCKTLCRTYTPGNTLQVRLYKTYAEGHTQQDISCRSHVTGYMQHDICNRTHVTGHLLHDMLNWKHATGDTLQVTRDRTHAIGHILPGHNQYNAFDRTHTTGLRRMGQETNSRSHAAETLRQSPFCRTPTTGHK